MDIVNELSTRYEKRGARTCWHFTMTMRGGGHGDGGSGGSSGGQAMSYDSQDDDTSGPEVLDYGSDDEMVRW